MWQEPADDALRTEDPAMAVFAPLMQYAERPEILFQKCRNIIDAKAKDIHWLNLLAATQVLAKPRYNDPALFEILGGQTIMIESPLLDEVRAQGELRAYRNSVLILSAAGSGTFKK